MVGFFFYIAMSSYLNIVWNSPFLVILDINKLTILGGGGEKYIIDNDNATLTLCLFSYNVPMSLGFPVQHCVQ